MCQKLGTKSHFGYGSRSVKSVSSEEWFESTRSHKYCWSGGIRVTSIPKTSRGFESLSLHKERNCGDSEGVITRKNTLTVNLNNKRENSSVWSEHCITNAGVVGSNPIFRSTTGGRGVRFISLTLDVRARWFESTSSDRMWSNIGPVIPRLVNE